MNKKEIFTAAKSGTPEGFRIYNSDEAAQAFAKLTISEATYARLSYAATQFGYYTANTAVLAVAGLYLGSLFFAPALIPFGLAAITTTWLKYAVAIAMLALVTFSGSIFLKDTYKEFLKLSERFQNKELTNHDLTLLASASVAGFGVVGMMYAFPTMLPLLGTLGTYTKAATASVITAASAGTLAAAFFGRATRSDSFGVRLVNPTKTGGGSEESVDGVDGLEIEGMRKRG